jgi:hypothetical protein
LLGALIIGGLAFLAWLVYGSFLWGWYANPCKPPCVSAPATTTVSTVGPATTTAPTSPAAATPAAVPATPTAKPSPAGARVRPVAPAPPRRVEISGSLDLIHHEGQTPGATTAQVAAPAQSAELSPEELADRFWRDYSKPPSP